MSEHWKSLAFMGYPNYEISTCGRVLGTRGIRKQQIDSNGYFTVILTGNNGDHRLLVHRLVAEAFISNPSKLPIVRHKGGRISNNNVENLFWSTRGLDT